MLSWVLIIGGLIIVAIVLLDVLWSTISTNGGGPMTMAVTIGCWKVARGLFLRLEYHRILMTNAAVILVLTFLAWVVPMWLGWTMVFSAVDEAVIHQMTGEPAGLADRAYFSAMVFLTLGTGDLVADAGGWRLLSTVAALNGLVVITLTITYLISVLAAVMEKRRLALLINAMGTTASDIVTNGWDGEDFDVLEDQLYDIAARLTLHAERHLAYPVLQYFHPRDDNAALPPALARLDDTTTLLSRCVEENARPNEATLQILRGAIDVYLDRVQLAHLSEVKTHPPTPDIDALDVSGVPVCEYRICREAFASRTDRRTTLCGLLQAEGWSWPGDRGQKAEDRRQRTEDGRQRTEDRNRGVRS